MLSAQDTKIIGLWVGKYPNPHTQYCYRLDSERLLKHAKKPLARITLGDLQAFAQSLIAVGLAPVSRVRVLAAVKSLFGFAFRMRHIPFNPARELALPRYEMRLTERILSEEDVRRILVAQQQPRDRVLLHLLYGAGLRVSEACNLRWRNLRPNSDGGLISVFGKGGQSRSIALPAGLWADLIGLRGSAAAEDQVFQSRSGKPLDRGRVRRIILEATRAAGINEPVSPHWLRHAHASHALDAGAPLSLVRDTLGHASISTTSAYLHARPGDSSARFLTVPTAQEQKPTQAANVALRARRVAPGQPQGPGKKPPQSVTGTSSQGSAALAAPAEETKGHQEAAVGAQARRVAPRRRQVGEVGHPAARQRPNSIPPARIPAF
jgi:integrase/recombinase XerD